MISFCLPERSGGTASDQARGADKTITNAIDSDVEDERRRDGDQGDATGTAG